MLCLYGRNFSFHDFNRTEIGELKDLIEEQEISWLIKGQMNTCDAFYDLIDVNCPCHRFSVNSKDPA